MKPSSGGFSSFSILFFQVRVPFKRANLNISPLIYSGIIVGGGAGRALATPEMFAREGKRYNFDPPLGSHTRGGTNYMLVRDTYLTQRVYYSNNLV